MSEPTPVRMKPAGVEPIKVMEECAECMLCQGVCPAFGKVEGYAGPMIFVRMAREGFDERDPIDRLLEAAQAKVLDCVSCFRCEETCPHEIPIRSMAIAALRGTGPTRIYPGAVAPPPPPETWHAPERAQPPRTFWERLTGSAGSPAQWELGMWAWQLHRVTGWLLAIYLFVHLWAVGTARAGEEEFNRLMAYFTHPVFLVGDLLLLGIFVFHALNGVRLILVDSPWRMNTKVLFWVSVAAAVVAMVASAPVFLAAAKGVGG
ncbi:MAG: succinate dehydrogenase, cytochrome b556 subunit [Nitrospinota bacterium]